MPIAVVFVVGPARQVADAKNISTLPLLTGLLPDLVHYRMRLIR